MVLNNELIGFVKTKPHYLMVYAIVLQKTGSIRHQPSKRYIQDFFSTDHKSHEQSKKRSVFLIIYSMQQNVLYMWNMCMVKRPVVILEQQSNKRKTEYGPAGQLD